MIPEILGQLWEEKKDRLESFLSFITSLLQVELGAA